MPCKIILVTRIAADQNTIAPATGCSDMEVGDGLLWVQAFRVRVLKEKADGGPAPQGDQITCESA